MFLWRHSIQEILSKWLPKSLWTTTPGYGCSRASFLLAKHAPNSENDSIDNSVGKVDDHLEKIDFADLLKDAKSVAGFSPSCQVKQNDVT